MLIPSQQGLFEMSPWRAKVVWSGGGHGMPAAGLTALSAALRTSVIPLRYPFRGSGHPVEVVERAPSCGRGRRYRPDRPLSRVLHLHQACMDHPLEVARQRLQVDGKPHPTAPSHPQAPKPVGALQLGVRSLDTSPYVIPLAPTPRWPRPSGAARCSPSPGPP